MKKPIKLNKKICGTGVMRSKCGGWISNGQWCVRERWAKAMKSTKEDVTLPRFDYDHNHQPCCLSN